MARLTAAGVACVFAVLLLSVPPAVAPGASWPSQTAANSCGSATTCTTSSSNYVSRSLTYSTSTGRFTGTVTYNQCPTRVTTFTQAAATCYTTTFPYITGSFPQAAGLLGPVGLSLGGMNIYGPFEAGFASGGNGLAASVCSTASGQPSGGWYCTPGMDVASCVDELYATCGPNQKFRV